jgi:hypothetical protein
MNNNNNLNNFINLFSEILLGDIPVATNPNPNHNNNTNTNTNNNHTNHTNTTNLPNHPHPPNQNNPPNPTNQQNPTNPTNQQNQRLNVEFNNPLLDFFLDGNVNINRLNTNPNPVIDTQIFRNNNPYMNMGVYGYTYYQPIIMDRYYLPNNFFNYNPYITNYNINDNYQYANPTEQINTPITTRPLFNNNNNNHQHQENGNRNTFIRRLADNNNLTLRQISITTTLDISNNIMTLGDIQTCAICQMDIIINQVVRKINHCNHIFHQNCIDIWLENHNTCPVCRHNLLSNGNDNTTGNTPVNTTGNTPVNTTGNTPVNTTGNTPVNTTGNTNLFADTNNTRRIQYYRRLRINNPQQNIQLRNMLNRTFPNTNLGIIPIEIEFELNNFNDEDSNFDNNNETEDDETEDDETEENN